MTNGEPASGDAAGPVTDEEGRSSYVLVNNRVEGNAPLTIQASSTSSMSPLNLPNWVDSNLRPLSL
jgi:hypothetical protein